MEKTSDPSTASSKNRHDFVIDDDFMPWIIEINTNPCLEESNDLLTKLLPRMIGTTPFLLLDDAFKLTLDSEFPKKKQKTEDSVPELTFPIKGYDDNENLFEFICSISNEKLPKQPVNSTKALILQKF